MSNQGFKTVTRKAKARTTESLVERVSGIFESKGVSLGDFSTVFKSTDLAGVIGCTVETLRSTLIKSNEFFVHADGNVSRNAKSRGETSRRVTLDSISPVKRQQPMRYQAVERRTAFSENTSTRSAQTKKYAAKVIEVFDEKSLDDVTAKSLFGTHMYVSARTREMAFKALGLGSFVTNGYLYVYHSVPVDKRFVFSIPTSGVSSYYTTSAKGLYAIPVDQETRETGKYKFVFPVGTTLSIYPNNDGTEPILEVQVTLNKKIQTSDETLDDCDEEVESIKTKVDMEPLGTSTVEIAPEA